LISKEGAAQIIAAEMGITFESERMKISELVQGMKRANVVGKITKVFPVREFKKNDREGKIGSFLLGDETSNIRTVLWDVNHISLIEKNELKEGDVIEIANGAIRNGEMHLSGFSDIKKSIEKIGKVKEDREFFVGKLKDASIGKSMKVRAVIVQTFEPRYFESKQNPGEKGVVWNIVLDDGSENIRAVLFTEAIKKMGLNGDDLFSMDKFNSWREQFLGEEKFFSGNFRNNDCFNRIEMAIDDVKDVNVEELVKELEAKV
jgi:ssDNA-binding replication factor A large subunit